MSIRVKGHALSQIYCYDTVSMKTRAHCQCGWEGSFRSNQRAREAHRAHKKFVSAAQYSEPVEVSGKGK